VVADTSSIHLGERILSELVPSSKIPTRVVFSISLLIPCEINKQKGLLLYNYEPSTWNTWFPPYHAYYWKMGFNKGSYKDLIAAAESACPDTTTLHPAGYLKETAAIIRDKFNIQELRVQDEPINEADYWLKYSKTKNEWTLYRFMYHVSRASLPPSFSNNPLFSVIPIDSQLKLILEKGVINGITVVDNLLYHLSRGMFLDKVHADIKAWGY